METSNHPTQVGYDRLRRDFPMVFGEPYRMRDTKNDEDVKHIREFEEEYFEKEVKEATHTIYPLRKG